MILIPQGVDVQVDQETNYGFCLDKFYKKIVRDLILCASKTFYMGEAMRKSIIDLAKHEASIRFCPTATNHSKIDSISVDKNETFTILTACRNSPKKNLKVIPAVIEELDRQKFKFKWILIGSGMKDLYFKPGLEKYYSIIDPIYLQNDELEFPPAELIRYYKSADCFVFPSLSEGMSLTTLDIMASRVPIICGNVPGITDLLDHSSCFIANITSPIDIANKIIRVDTHGSEQVTEAAYRLSLQYSWNRVEEIYRNEV